jgi:GST-like protein
VIELWSWPAPAARPVHILLEETGLPYSITPVNTGSEGQIDREFLSIAPNYRVPAIVDLQNRHAPVKLFEAGAILIYLAEKAGNFIPLDPAARYICLQWLMFQTSCLGPAVDQYHRLMATHDGFFAGVKPAAQEIQRLADVLEQRLALEDYLAGSFSIADMAAYTWIAAAATQAISLETFPAISRWADRLAGRRAVGRGMELMRELQ